MACLCFFFRDGYADPIVTGMQMVWVMGNETEIMTVPAKDVEGYLVYGGSVNGNETYDPSPVHFKGN